MKCDIRRGTLQLVLKKLEDYSFAEKMLFCQENSKRLIQFNSLDISVNNDSVFPWELEAFAELSLFSDAKKININSSDSDAEFIRMINQIRNFIHPYFKLKKNMNYVDDLLMVKGLQQFKCNENVYNRLYRYNYFWNYADDKINMSNVFSHKFNSLRYKDFRDLVTLIFFYDSIKPGDSNSVIISSIMLHFKKIVECLKISKEDYKKKQGKKIEDNIINVIYGFNYLKTFPFIEFENSIFLPLPHLIIDAVTDSLLTRATENDDTLRGKIGKYVAQSYIEKIFDEGKVYDQVLPEVTYNIGKNQFDSPDVLIKKDNCFCFIDTKLSCPKLSIRLFDKVAIESTIARYANNIIQIFNRINEFSKGIYYPFKDKTLVEKINVFGIVAVLEDSYISRNQIYEFVLTKLGINAESEEGKYIKSNIKITSFRDLENFAFNMRDIFLSLKYKRDDSSCWYDFPLYKQELYKSASKNILPSRMHFHTECVELLKLSINEFKTVFDNKEL